MDKKNMNKGALWITRTAIFAALLLVVQVGTAPLSNTLITGSAVNMILIVSVMACGLSSGLAIATISPVLAKIVGIGPLWSLIPFIIFGNIVLVLLWHIIGNKSFGNNKFISYTAAAVIAAVAKFGVLYVGVVKIAVPLVLKMEGKQAIMISTMFSVPQLITALIGGAIAIAIVPVLKNAIAANG